MCRALLLVVATSGLLGCAARREPQPWPEVRGVPAPETQRHTTQGDLVGFVEPQGTHAWLGVPYAEPPVGPLRWKATRPGRPWDGLREATRFGALCPQLGGTQDKVDVVGSEDCLTLSLFAPAFASAEEAATQRRAVMVWVHGGGDTLGTGSAYAFARNLALRHGVVMVVVNYRLGVLGWFHHPALRAPGESAEDASGNYGTLDLVEALRWVRANAAAFGGDPGNVTAFGESAGGFDVYSLLGSPLARGLFQRAAVQSGIPATASLAEASHLTDDAEPGAAGSSGEVLLAQLQRDGVAGGREGAKQALAAMGAEQIADYLRARPPEQLLAPFKGSGGTMYACPVLLRDGHVLPAGPLAEALAQGPQVPVLLGTNRDEAKFFMALDPKYVTQFLGLFAKDAAVYERDARLTTDVWRVVGVDVPGQALRRAGAPVYAYRFDWDEEPRSLFLDMPLLLGAGHGLDVGFVFDDEAGELDPIGVYTEDNKAGRVKLMRAMASYWVQFARDGNPGGGVEVGARLVIACGAPAAAEELPCEPRSPCSSPCCPCSPPPPPARRRPFATPRARPSESPRSPRPTAACASRWWCAASRRASTASTCTPSGSAKAPTSPRPAATSTPAPGSTASTTRRARTPATCPTSRWARTASATGTSWRAARRWSPARARSSPTAAPRWCSTPRRTT